MLQVLKYQLELSQFKQELERKTGEKEDEVESMRYVLVPHTYYNSSTSIRATYVVDQTVSLHGMA